MQLRTRSVFLTKSLNTFFLFSPPPSVVSLDLSGERREENDKWGHVNMSEFSRIAALEGGQTLCFAKCLNTPTLHYTHQIALNLSDL